MKQFKSASIKAIGLACAIGIFASVSMAQPPDKAAVEQTLLNIFAHMDATEVKELKKYLSPNLEVFDGSYSLRLDGLEAFADYLEDQQGAVRDLKTAVRQPSVHIFGSAAVVNFYFTQDYVVIEEGPSEEDAFVLRNRRMGRGTVVLVKSGSGWLAETIHLSQFSE